MAASDYKNYNEELQQLFLEFCATDPELFVRVKNIVKQEYFSGKLQNAIKFMLEHTEQYNTLPTLEQIKATSDVELKKIDMNEQHKNWFFDVEDLNSTPRTTFDLLLSPETSGI